MLRRHGDLLITLFSLMVACGTQFPVILLWPLMDDPIAGIPELQTADEINWMRDALHYGITEDKAAAAFEQIINDCLNTKFTQVS